MTTRGSAAGGPVRAIARLAATVLWILTGSGCSSGLARRVPSGPPARQPAVLDVPYLPQSVLLCGGAAIAMVERWWGRRGVYAEDFASLVRPASGGILTTELAEATRARGWDTQTLRGSPDLVRQNLREGIPVVALIQVASDRYHYVVVLGWRDGQVVFHDPARAPFTELDEDSFLARWTAADRWALVVQPAPVIAPAVIVDSPAQQPTDTPMPCPPWLDRALDAVARNELDNASALLAQADHACPMEPLVLRETAGVRFKQGRYEEAIRIVSDYLVRVPDDEYAWQLLATSRYLSGDRDGALEAWNRVGRPTVDLVRIDGVREIRFREIAAAVSAPPGTLLTSSRLALARRRVADVPALRGAAVDYQPVAGGIVEVRAAVVERPIVDPAWRLVAVTAIGAVAQQQVGFEIASPTGGGELWTWKWRWASARPRAAFRLDMPADRLKGVVVIEGVRERFRFALDDAGVGAFEESRRSVAVGFGGWVSPAVRPAAGLRLERWSGSRRYLAASVGAELRALDDRFELGAQAEHALALRAPAAYTSVGGHAAWASSLGLGRTTASARLGFEWVDHNAPLGAWPVAGSDLSWALPLRAHNSTSGGVLAGGSTGQTIFTAGLSGDHPVYRTGPLVFAAGLFLDAARIVTAADGSPDRFFLDAGAGLRIGMANGVLGVLRIDLARSLVSDQVTALTVGVHHGWPLIPRRHP